MLTSKATVTNSRAFIDHLCRELGQRMCLPASVFASVELSIVTGLCSVLYDRCGLRHAGGHFVIELMYKAPLPEVDAQMRAHVRFLKKYYASGHFLVSGRKVPRDGGIIVAVGRSREEIEAIARQDPFCARGLADFRVIEFRASQRADDIERRIAAASVA